MKYHKPGTKTSLSKAAGSSMGMKRHVEGFGNTRNLEGGKAK